MTRKIEDASREQIARFLPDALRCAVTSYQKFSKSFIENGAKKFSEHHTACKVAIAHIEMLLKLARFADLPDAGARDHGQQILLAAMMQEAEAELRTYKEGGLALDYIDAEATE